MDDNHKKLIQRFLRGESTVLRDIVKIYRPGIRRFATRLLIDRYSADEILQDVLIVLWDQREKLAAVHNLDGYIYRLARNKTLDALKRQVAHRNTFQNLDSQWNTSFEDNHDIFSNETMSENLHQDLGRALKELPPRMKQAFVLTQVDGLSYAQAASRLGVSPKTIQAQIIQARSRLRKALATVALFISIFF